jgi:hypothetical protein
MATMNIAADRAAAAPANDLLITRDEQISRTGTAMAGRYVKADPYLWPYNGSLSASNTALIVIDMQTDFCGVGGGQTAAAHDLCSGLRPYLRRHHMQAGVGHYGVFSGSRWANQIYPLVRNVILASE